MESVFNNQTNHLEVEDNCNIVNNINLSDPANDSVDTDAKEISECHQTFEKMKTEEKTCRFCFKMCCNFKTIDGDIKDVSNLVLSGIDLSAIQEPVMCTHCEEVLFMSFDFKARCLYTHDYLMPFVNKKDDGVKLNLKDIYMTKHKNNISITEDQNICGFCMCLVKNCSAIYPDVGDRDVMLRKTLGQCLPELDFSIIEEPVICAPCHAALENHFRFVTNVLIGEEKITKYKESLEINSKSQIDLSCFGQFILSEVDGCGDDAIKLEDMSCDCNESADKEVEHKCNAMDIDDLQFNNEQKFTPTDSLYCKIESNEISAIKIEEPFCAEGGTEFKEGNIVEMEDHKMLFNEEIEIKTEELDFNGFEERMFMTQEEVNTKLNEEQGYSKSANIEDNLLKQHIVQTPVKLNVTKIGTYLCEYCSFQTENKYHLKKHLLKHKFRSEMTIRQGSFLTKNKKGLKHIHKSPELTMHKCDSCAYQTIYKGVLKTHLLKHKDPSEVTMHKCDSCKFQTIYKRAIKLHLLKHRDISGVTMYKCDSCSYQTKYKSGLNRHLLKHKDSSEVTMHKCDSCAYQTIHKCNLKSHLLIHKNPSEVTMHKCSSCTYQTIHKQVLKKHTLTHKDISEVIMYKCDSCVYQTKYRWELKRHLLQHNNPSEVTMHKCDSCAFQTLNKGVLRRHSIRHKDISEATMHKCGSCAYQTIHKGVLKMHMLKHKDISEVTMYKCDSCEYRTKYKAELKRHLLLHKNSSEVTMYKCDSCLYQTKHKAGLKKHSLKHKNSSEVTMYKCDSCAHQTIRKNDLKRHSLKHKDISKVEMHKCDSCNFQTIYKRAIKVHLLKHKDNSEGTIYCRGTK